jgi:hypothetical protein
MNERIKELAKQCWDQRLDGQLHIDTEQFAESIVRECMSIVNQEELLTDYVSAEMNKYAGKRLKNAWLKIEQHFGVEEK